MFDVEWNKIASSSSGNFETYYARLVNGFLIKNIESSADNQQHETISFFAINEPSCDWELEEL